MTTLAKYNMSFFSEHDVQGTKVLKYQFQYFSRKVLGIEFVTMLTNNNEIPTTLKKNTL